MATRKFENNHIIDDLLPEMIRLKVVTKCEKDLGLPDSTIRSVVIGRRNLPLKYEEAVRGWYKKNIKKRKKPDVKKPVSLRDFFKNKNNDNADDPRGQEQAD